MIREYFRRGYRTMLPLLYARSNFKLFLKVGLGELDLRLQQLASVTDLFSSAVRPIPIQAPFGRSLLVLAPHQDDEIIGCGGALALQVDSGSAARIVILHDGADGCEELGMRREELSALRNEESRRAAAVLGLEPRFLSHANLAAESGKAVQEVGRLISETHADAIFAPFPLDGHPDHRTTNYILADALKTVGWNVRVFGYEVWGFCIPNVIVVIDRAIDRKMEMLACFTFANQAVDYIQTTKGVNMYRSRLLGPGMSKYAECFFEAPKAEYIELVNRIREREIAAKAAKSE
jgi:LmbE family N-acetylglucosaminyl deacetylase